MLQTISVDQQDVLSCGCCSCLGPCLMHCSCRSVIMQSCRLLFIALLIHVSIWAAMRESGATAAGVHASVPDRQASAVAGQMQAVMTARSAQWLQPRRRCHCRRRQRLQHQAPANHDLLQPHIECPNSSYGKLLVCWQLAAAVQLSFKTQHMLTLGAIPGTHQI